MQPVELHRRCAAHCSPCSRRVASWRCLVLLLWACMQAENTGRVPAWQRAAKRLLSRSQSYASKSQQRLQEHGVSRTARKHPLTGRWEIAPVADGRIRIVGASSEGGGSSGEKGGGGVGGGGASAS